MAVHIEDEARQFWDDARQRANDGQTSFSEERFPPDPSGVGFRGTTFQADVDFTKAVFEGDVSFSRAVFKGCASFRNTTFGKQAQFDSAVFEQDADFNFAEFVAVGNFWMACFKAEALFQGVVFKDNAEFGDATFEGDRALFLRSSFGAAADFRKATFKGQASFVGVEAKSCVWFSYPWDRRKPFLCAKDGETAYRLAKRTMQGVGDYAKAGDYHFAERCASNAGARSEAWETLRKRDFRGTISLLSSWGGLVLGRWLFGYGERPSRPLIVAVVVILACAVLYSVGGVVTHQTDDGTFCLGYG